jgi:hypothetical protein
MTTKRIAYQRPDGGVSVVIPAPAYVQQLMGSGMTEAQAIDAIRQRDVPADAVAVEVLEAADLPQTREGRNRWRLS